MNHLGVPQLAFDPVRAIEAHGRHRPTKAALIDHHGSVTYRELWSHVMRLADWLRESGVRPGDRVASALTPSAAHAALVLAILESRAVVAPLNTRLSPAETTLFTAPLEPTFVVAEPSNAEHLDSASPLVVAPRTDQVCSLGEWIDQLVAARRTFAGPAPRGTVGDAALILGTGGTTGLPKAATFTRAALALWCTHAASAQRLHSSDVELYASPFYHGTVVTSLLAVLTAGATAVVVNDPADPTHSSLVRDAGVTRLGGAPTLLARLAAGPLADDAARGSIRVIQYGTMTAPRGFVREMSDAFPSAQLFTGYGATEFGPVTRLHAEDLDGRERGVGRPVPHVAVGVIVDDGISTDAGFEGELVVRSPWQMEGYWGDVAGTSAVRIHDGSLRSGDIASFDDDGFVHLRGRSRDIIITGGENVHPSEVERVLVQHPSIAELAVYGVDDPEWGERIEAAVVVGTGATLSVEALRTFARSQLAGYKFPKAFRAVTALPLTSNFKIDRLALRRQAEASVADPEER